MPCGVPWARLLLTTRLTTRLRPGRPLRGRRGRVSLGGPSAGIQTHVLVATIQRHPKTPRHTPLRALPHQCVPTSTERLPDSHPPTQRRSRRPSHLLHHREVRFVRTFVASGPVTSNGNGEAARRPLPRGTCPRCGAAWIGRRSGRPGKWCSQACRRAAYEERRAAAKGAIAVREVEVLRAAEHGLSICVQRVAESPTAVKRLLRSLEEPGRIRMVATELRWEPARDEVVRLLEQINRETASHGPRRWL